MTCTGVSPNSTIETPQVTLAFKKKHSKHNHIAAILGAAMASLVALLCIPLLVLLYIKKRRNEVNYAASMYHGESIKLLHTKKYCMSFL